MQQLIDRLNAMVATVAAAAYPNCPSRQPDRRQAGRTIRMLRYNDYAQLWANELHRRMKARLTTLLAKVRRRAKLEETSVSDSAIVASVNDPSDRLFRVPVHAERAQFRRRLPSSSGVPPRPRPAEREVPRVRSGSMPLRAANHAASPRFRPAATSAGFGEIAARRAASSRQRTARRRLTQPLALARAAQHMGGVSSCTYRYRPRPPGLDQPAIVNRSVEAEVPPLPSIAPHRAAAAGRRRRRCRAQRANPAAARHAASSSRLRMFSATRAPSAARRSASCQRPCQISETDTQLRTELATGWVEPSSRVIASLKTGVRAIELAAIGQHAAPCTTARRPSRWRCRRPAGCAAAWPRRRRPADAMASSY